MPIGRRAAHSPVLGTAAFFRSSVCAQCSGSAHICVCLSIGVTACVHCRARTTKIGWVTVTDGSTTSWVGPRAAALVVVSLLQTAVRMSGSLCAGHRRPVSPGGRGRGGGAAWRALCSGSASQTPGAVRSDAPNSRCCRRSPDLGAAPPAQPQSRGGCRVSAHSATTPSVGGATRSRLRYAPALYL